MLLFRLLIYLLERLSEEEQLALALKASMDTIQQAAQVASSIYDPALGIFFYPFSSFFILYFLFLFHQTLMFISP